MNENKTEIKNQVKLNRFSLNLFENGVKIIKNDGMKIDKLFNKLSSWKDKSPQINSPKYNPNNILFLVLLKSLWFYFFMPLTMTTQVFDFQLPLF